MIFLRRLGEFLLTLRVAGEKFPPGEMARAYVLQLAACLAVASVETGEPLDPMIDAACDQLRKTAPRMRDVEVRRRRN